MEENGKMNKVREMISGFQSDRNQLQQEILSEKSAINQVEAELAQIKMQHNSMSNKIAEKQQIINQYDRMIQEAEATLLKLNDNSNKLFQTLESEGNKIKMRQTTKNP